MPALGSSVLRLKLLAVEQIALFFIIAIFGALNVSISGSYKTFRVSKCSVGKVSENICFYILRLVNK